MASTIRSMDLECGRLKVPVALRGASEKKDVSFERAYKEVIGHEDDGKEIVAWRRIKRLDVIDPGEEATVLEIDPLRREARSGKIESKQYDGELTQGIWDGDEFIPVAQSDVDQIEEMTRVEPLVLQEFIPLDAVPWERATASYFLAPDSKAGVQVLRHLEALRSAMESKGVAGVGKLMPKSRQKLCVVYPKHGGLMVTCLAYADTFQQVLDGAASMDGIVANPAVVGALETLVEAKLVTPEALNEYRDDAIDLKADLMDRVKHGGLVREADATDDTEPTWATVPNDDALLEQLQASIEQIKTDKKKDSRAKKPAAKPGATSTSRRGKKPAKV